jgi:hypothetical protein
LQVILKKKTIENNELKQMVETERKGKEAAVKAVEEDHKKKFDSLKSLVEQYRG